MSEQHEPEQTSDQKSAEPVKVEEIKEPQLPVPIKNAEASTSLLAEPKAGTELATAPSNKQESEWIPGEQLELIRIPPPTIWPATLALGITGIAFGVVTHWILSLAGLFLFMLGAAGWIEDLKKDVL